MASYSDIVSVITAKPVGEDEPIFKAPSDPTAVVGIQQTQNLQTISAARRASQLTADLVGLTKEQEVVQKQAQEGFDEITRATNALLTSFRNEVEEETRALDEVIEVYDTGAMAAQTKIADIQSQGRTSFWKNPIQNLREGSQLRKAEEELVKLDQYRRNAQLQKNRIYAAKDEQYRRLMDESIGVGYEVVKAEYNQNLLSLNAKRATIDTIEQGNREVQKLSQELKVNMEAWRSGKDIKDYSSMAEFYYYLTNNGDTTGFVAERDVESFKFLVNSLPQEERLAFTNNFMQYQRAKLAGVPFSLGELAIAVTESNGLEGLSNFALLVGDDSLRQVQMRGQQILMDQRIQEKIEEWQNSPDRKATDELSSSQFNAIREEALTHLRTSSGEDILKAAALATGEAISTYSTQILPNAYYGDTARVVIENADLSEDVKAFFRTDIPQRAQSEALDIIKDVGSEQAAYAVKLMEEMDAAGIDEADSIDAIQALFTGVALSNFFDTKEGTDAKVLSRMGVTFGYKTDFDELDDTKVPVQTRFKYYSESPSNVNKLYRLPVLEGEEGILQGVLKKSGQGTIDLSNRIDLIQLRTRIGKSRQSYLRGKELREDLKRNRGRLSRETYEQNRPQWYNPTF